jgi:hypothetical protein
MRSTEPRRIEATIRRLTKQIEALDRLFNGVNAKGDRFLYAGMLERKLDDFVRGAVLQMHTAIEDLLTGAIRTSLLGVRPRHRKAVARAIRTVRGRTTFEFLDGPQSLGFAQKVRLARALGIIRTRVGKQLGDLNKMRNACSHHWVLNVRIRRNVRVRKQKPPLIAYRGQNLHRPSVFEEFIGEYSGVYLRLHINVNGLH